MIAGRRPKPVDQSPQAPGTAPAARSPPPAPFFRAPVGNPRLRAVKESDKTRSKGRERQGTTAYHGPPQGLWSRQPSWQPCSSSSPGPPQDKEALTLIQGWFMNCVMVSLSVGSVFSRRRISCLASEERAVVRLWSCSEPVPAPRDHQLCNVLPNS